jgi:hypothetical protein
MARPARLVASATVSTLIAFGAPIFASAQTTESKPAAASAVSPSAIGGAIVGTVNDDHGRPVANVVVSALGAATVIAVTDKTGRFEFGPLTPGAYLLRAHLAGYLASRGQTVHVGASAQTTSVITLTRGTTLTPVLAAAFGGSLASHSVDDTDPAAVTASDDPDTTQTTNDQSETAWRIRHARRSVLKDLAIPVELLTDADGARRSGGGFVPVEFLGRAVESPAHFATSLLSDTALTGQVNFLTTGSFDTPQDFFSTDVLSRNIAYVRVGAPVGSDADWSARGAVNQADVSSWIVAGSYTTHTPTARHQYDLGLSYSTQRYDGGNLLTLRDVSENSRNVGTVYGYDTFRIAPMLALAYGGAYARYDYLKDRSLISPRVAATFTPADQLRITGSVARYAVAPGAEEFLPPGDTGIWLPPQRTFSSLNPRSGFSAEETTQMNVGVERDFGASTVSVRAFQQRMNDQLLTVFGAEMPGQPAANVGHYVVESLGDAQANGYATALRTVIARRVRGSVEYSTSMAVTTPPRQVGYLLLVAPATARLNRERLHDVATSVETEVPETATRVLVLYRVGNGFARGAGTRNAATPGIDSRFDVQVRQSLPFMNFSNAKWEMLLAVRNFFHESGTEQSVLDERLVVRPPKRVVGGVTLRF